MNNRPLTTNTATITYSNNWENTKIKIVNTYDIKNQERNEINFWNVILGII